MKQLLVSSGTLQSIAVNVETTARFQWFLLVGSIFLFNTSRADKI